MGIKMELNSHGALAAILTVTTIVAVGNLTLFIKRTALALCNLPKPRAFCPTADTYNRVVFPAYRLNSNLYHFMLP